MPKSRAGSSLDGPGGGDDARFTSGTDSWTLDLLPGFFYGGQKYLGKPATCAMSCYQNLTCGFNPSMPFRASGDKSFTYTSACTECCPWKVVTDEGISGFIRRAGMCDNGCCYCLCSCCVCKEVITIKFSNSSDKMVNTMRIFDGLLRKCCFFLGPCGSLCCACLTDSCAWCQNLNTVIISEKVFGADLDDDTPQAEVVQVYGIKPLVGPCCCVYRYPIRTAIKSYQSLQDDNMVGVFSLLPLMQSGKIENASICPRMPLLPAATGSCCDCGRRVTFKRMTFSDMLSDTEAAGAPATTVDDAVRETVINQRGESRLLKTTDELDEMPTKPWLGFETDLFTQEVVISKEPMARD